MLVCVLEESIHDGLIEKIRPFYVSGLRSNILDFKNTFKKQVISLYDPLLQNWLKKWGGIEMPRVGYSHIYLWKAGISCVIFIKNNYKGR